MSAEIRPPVSYTHLNGRDELPVNGHKKNGHAQRIDARTAVVVARPVLAGEYHLKGKPAVEHHRGGEAIVSEVPLLPNVIARYREFHNLENGDAGARQAHNQHTDDLYSHSLLPCISAIDQVGRELHDPNMLQASNGALASLDSALGIIDTYAAERGLDTRTAFDLMQAEDVDGGDDTFYRLKQAMKKARQSAIVAIAENAHRVPPDMLVGNGHQAPFGEKAAKALQEFQEAEYGLDLGEEFANQLHDPNKKVVVLSLDINSTFNAGESHASPSLIKRVTSNLKVFAARFKAMYPDKEIIIPLNTGRPALYEWGAQEILAPLPEMRKVGFAESGGVITRIENAQQTREVAVENPHLWKEQLEGLRLFMLSQIKDKHSVIIEPKDSMLSIQLAQKDGGDYMHVDTDGNVVTEDWITRQTTAYLANSERQLQQRLLELTDLAHKTEVADQALTAILNKVGAASAKGMPGGIDDEIVATVERVFDEAEAEKAEVIRRTTEAHEMIQLMKAKLAAKYNPTAGYVDIGNTDLNKFSTLFKTLEGMGYKREDALVLHVGDSGTDMVPTDKTGEGEVNEGCDKVFVVGVANSSKGLKASIEKRGEYGKLASRESVLGLSDTVKGVMVALQRK